jgi:hypothetical protein
MHVNSPAAVGEFISFGGNPLLMTLNDWVQTASDNLEFLECVGYALQDKADLCTAPDASEMKPCEEAVLTLWTYLAANPEWYPMPVSREDVATSLRRLSLGDLERRIPEDLRAPSSQLAHDLLSRIAEWLRANSGELQLGEHLERQRDWMNRRKDERARPYLLIECLEFSESKPNKTVETNRLPLTLQAVAHLCVSPLKKSCFPFKRVCF